MSSTTNVQNLLTNVFRPRYTFNTLTSNYQTKLELVNIDTVSANTVTAYSFNIGDPSGNAYIGLGAGNDHTTRVANSNSYNTFIGVNAGKDTSNVKNSVFMGYRAGYAVINASNSISIGTNNTSGGNSNIYIGCSTSVTGDNNIFIGHGISNAGVSNALLIGSGSNTAIVGDFAASYDKINYYNRVGVNMSSLPAIAASYVQSPVVFYVNGYTRIGGTTNNGRLGVNTNPTDYHLDVNGTMQISNSVGTLTFENGIVKAPTIQATSGFFSKSGTVTIGSSSSDVIGILQKGIVLASAHDIASVSNYATRMFAVTVSNTTYAAASMANTTSNATVTSSGSNITLSNSTGSSITFTYSITYFPST